MFVLVILLWCAPAPAQEAPPEFILKWGTPGTGDGQFSGPHGIVVDLQSNVYIADTGNNRIQKFTSDGTFIMKWGSLGAGDGQFNHPHGIGIDSSGNLFVSATVNNRVQKFTSDGVFLTKWGTFGTGDGQFRHNHGLAVDDSGYVYVVDRDNSNVQKFTGDGVFVLKWGTPGVGPGQFTQPNGVTADCDGNVYVADSANRIQKFTTTGMFVSQWGSAGAGDGQFNFPRALSHDPAGNVYVADRNNHRMQKFTPKGIFLTTWGTEGTGDGQFSFPYAVAADASGNIYVNDSSNNRIQKFGPAMVPVLVVAFRAERLGAAVTLRWEIGDPADSGVGFHVYRQLPSAVRTKLTPTLLTGQIAYAYTDPQPPPDEARYWLLAIDSRQTEFWYGPVSIAKLDLSGAVVQSYPNPFRLATTIRLSVSEPGLVRLSVYDAQGRRIKRILNRETPAGVHFAVWDGRDSNGKDVASGIYFIRVDQLQRTHTTRVIRIK